MQRPKRVRDAREVFDGVPSLHDAKSCVVMAQLHRQGVSRAYSPLSEDRVRLRARVRRREVFEKRQPRQNSPKNDDLRALLLAAGDKTLAEASPEDCIWGIGLSADDPRALTPSPWRGKNWLGETLARVRAELRRS